MKGIEDRNQWDCGIELQYANPELVYARPKGAKDLERKEIQSFPPEEAKAMGIVHVPPLSGIERDEPRRDRGMQDLLVGQGRPGEILRICCWKLPRAAAQKTGKRWPATCTTCFESNC